MFYAIIKLLTKDQIMNTYEVWVRINSYQTVHVRINADSDYQAKMIAEAQYGHGNVLNYTKVND